MNGVSDTWSQRSLGVTESGRDARIVAAQRIDEGWGVLPLRRGAKLPKLTEWQKRVFTADAFARDDNIGGMLGNRSGRRADVDCDSAAAVALAPHYLPSTDSRFGRASKLESHRVYRIAGEGPIKTQQFKTKTDGMIVELRGDGAQSVIPDSVHASGELIEWSANDEPFEIAYSELLEAVGRLALASMVAGRWKSLSGNLHHLALALTAFLIRGGWSDDDLTRFYTPIFAYVSDDNPDHWYGAITSTSRRIANGEPVTGERDLIDLLGVTEVRKIREWLRLAAGQNTTDERLTDAGNLDRFVERHGGHLRHADGLGPLRYEGGRWQTGAEGAFHELATETARSWRSDPAADPVMRRWGIDSLAWSKRKAIVEAAKLDPRLAIRADQLDADPWLLNVRNGTLHLKATAEDGITFRPHDPEDFLTKMSPTAYDPDAACPLWLEALEASVPDPEERAWLQRYLGYALTGHAYEKMLLLVHGIGDTGKTTIVNTPRGVLGPDYGAVVAEKTIAKQRGDGGVPSDVARLRGVRYGVVSETNEGTSLNIGRLKAWSGRNRQIARFMRENEFEFDQTMKLVIETNHQPLVHEADEAFFNRVVVFPFQSKIAIPDPAFDEKLKGEYSGILNWLIEGCLDWQAKAPRGLEPPESLKRQTQLYQEENSPVDDFLTEHLTIGTAPKPTPKADVLAAYLDWAKRTGVVVPMKRNRLYQLVEAAGGVADVGTGNVRVFTNVTVRQPPVGRY